MSAPVAVFGLPMYNETVHLAEALESLLSQSRPDLAVVLVDDSTSDEPREVAERYVRGQYTGFLDVDGVVADACEGQMRRRPPLRTADRDEPQLRRARHQPVIEAEQFGLQRPVHDVQRRHWARPP